MKLKRILLSSAQGESLLLFPLWFSLVSWFTLQNCVAWNWMPLVQPLLCGSLAAVETTQKKRISYQILIFCQQIHSGLQGNNSGQIEELHGCYEVIYVAHRLSAQWIWVCNSLWWSMQAYQCPWRRLWSHFTPCAERNLLRGQPAKPSPN